MAMLLAILAAIISVTSVNDSYPHQGRDGTKLVFHSDRSGKNALWLAGGDGKNPKLLFDGGSLGTSPVTAKISPDGRSIVFAMNAADAPNGSDVFLLTIDDGSVRRLTRGMGDASHPVWNSDGSRIFFNANRRTSPATSAEREWSEIYSMAPDGTGVRQHTDCNAVCTYPAPSPDGRLLAYRKILKSPGRQWNQKSMPLNSEVVVAPLAGGPEINLSKHEAFDGWPAWTPDSRWVAFASSRQGQPNVGQIYFVKPDGGGLHAVTEGPLSHAQPSFSADGKTMFVYELYETDEFGIGHIAKTAIDVVRK
jgi:TolB protein